MRKITLNKLVCIENEDWTGKDTCRLEIFLDGVLQPSLKKDMDEGDTWQLNRAYTFKDKVEVKLWDEDFPDADDLLGSAIIGNSLQGNGTASFTQDGANYKLWYSVVDAPDVNLVQEALTRFETSAKSGVWTHIAKANLLEDIKKKIANPFLIQQKTTPFCGPAVIVFELVSRQPHKYVDICKELYETGQFKGRTKTVKPSQKLLKSKVRKGITVADWMVMGAMRDAENGLFPVEASSYSIVGITTPWEIKGWTSEILGYNKVEYERTYIAGEFEAMKVAKKVREQGGVAFLMIHSAMLGHPEPLVSFPNHWVSFLGNLVIDDGSLWSWDSGHIKFNCYSWGETRLPKGEHDDPPDGVFPVNIGEGPFEDHFWGCVTGKMV
jgi:hypothetical protein